MSADWASDRAAGSYSANALLGARLRRSLIRATIGGVAAGAAVSASLWVYIVANAWSERESSQIRLAILVLVMGGFVGGIVGGVTFLCSQFPRAAARSALWATLLSLIVGAVAAVGGYYANEQFEWGPCLVVSVITWPVAFGASLWAEMIWGAAKKLLGGAKRQQSTPQVGHARPNKGMNQSKRWS